VRIAAALGTALLCSILLRPGPGGEADAFAAGAVPGCMEETVARIGPVVRWHSELYSELAAEDLYKLLHQGVAGPGHAIEDPGMARAWLEREWSGLRDPDGNEPLFEPLSADGRLVRVNLRPWRSAGLDRERVLTAFLETAEAVTPSPDEIRSAMDAIRACSGSLAVEADIPAVQLDSLFAKLATEGYPAVHHSAGYRQAYSPAYRVVLREYLD